ncbi:uncharacterized protein [Diadema setosum]|uniref:uncharacterized protein n=1 Tax=Diadema setosum TaxID=31175 RepID=UPI003B3B9D93
MKRILLLVAQGLVLLALNGAARGGSYVEIASFDADDAAFSAIHENPNNPDQLDLTVSTFNANPLSTDEVYVIRDIGSKLGSSNLNSVRQTLADGLLWPNEVEPVPEDVFGTDRYWWVANGFLVPGKTAGSIGLIEADSSSHPAPYHDLTTGSVTEHWWYHRVYFVDVDGDGRKDMLTARADTSSASTTLAEMVYFSQPRMNPISSTWDVDTLFEGPDALFRYEEIPMSPWVTRTAIFSTQYFAEKLVASWSDDDQPDFKNLNHRTIEAIADNRYFDCEYVDINGDGRKDLLVSINSKSNGQLVVFEIPDNWATGTWTRHLIAEGFKPPGLVVTEGMGSPGTTFTFRPDGTYRNKPLIMLTGDDDSNIYVFETENDSDTNNWSYTKRSIFEATDGTVGAPTVHDLDGDGNVEVIIPCYSDGSVHVLSYEP